MNTYIICLLGNTWYSLNLKNENYQEKIVFGDNNKYITFQISDFIRLLKSENRTHVPEIINLESLEKQFSQIGKDISGYNKWNILKILKREGIILDDYKLQDAKSLLVDLKKLYTKLIENNTDEFKRYEETELKINEIIHKITFDGIKVNFELAKERCKYLHYQLYKIKNKLQLDYNIFQPDKTSNQLQYLQSKNYKILNSCRETIRLRRKSDVICELLHELIKTSQDLKSLIFITSQYGGKDFVHPQIIGFGTITSRVIMKEPSFQNLRKSNRDIIVPVSGKSLVYIDYSQFEAGILASVSKDEQLLSLYNKSDIYSDMVKKILVKEDSKENRKEAKIIFYRYLYGDDFSGNIFIKRKITDYFNKFRTLNTFKNDIVKESKKLGIVKTHHGNGRILLEQNENIWILSHYIQSIASYIFKRSMIEVYENVTNARLLLPLHDGALYEVNEIHLQESKNKIRDIFIKNLKSNCPELINADATFQNFWEPCTD